MLVLLLFVFVVYGQKNSCDISCFLGSLVVDLPWTNFTGRELLKDYNVTFYDLQCQNFQVAQFDSSAPSNITIGVGVTDLSFSCTGNWEAKWGFHDHGTLSGVGAGSFDTLSVLHSNQTSGLAISVNLTMCNTTADVSVTLRGPKWISDLFAFFEKRFHKQINDQIDAKVCAFLAKVDSVYITDVIQDVNAELIGFIAPPPPTIPPLPSNVTLSNLVNNSVVNLIEFFVQRVLGPEGLNTALNIINISSLEFDFSAHQISFPILGKNGNVSVVVSNVALAGNFASWRNFSLFSEKEVEIGFDSYLEGPLFLNLSINYNASFGQSELSSDGLIQLELKDISLRFFLLVLANQTYYDLMMFEDLETLPCLGQGILNMSLLQLLGASSLKSFVLSGPSNSSALSLSFLHMIDEIVAVALSNYAQFLSPLLDYVIFDSIARLKINDWVGEFLMGVQNSSCVPPIAADNDGVNFFAMMISFSVWGAVAIGVVFLGYFIHKKQYESLAGCTNLSLLTKLIVPLSVIACFAVNNVTSATTSAVLLLRLTTGERVLTSPALFTMDLKSSIVQAWNAGVYQMVLVIILFQSVVPYLKLICISVAWYIPENRIGKLFFIRILTFFDHLGRFQLISGFILVLYSIAFHFHIDSNTTETARSNAIVDSFIVVYTDFWMFMSVVVASILLNSFVLRVLRLEYYDKFESPNLTNDSALVSAFVWILLIVGGGLMAAGIVLNSFVLEFQGLGGYVLSLVGMSPDRPYSIVTMGWVIRDGWTDPLSVAAILLQALYYLLAVAFPLCQLVCCALCWFFRDWAYRSNSTILFRLTDIFCVWASVDVFVLAILSSVVSLSQYSVFIIGDKCDGINRLIRTYAPHALDDEVCVNVDSSLELGVFLLAAGCLVVFVVSRFILYKTYPFKRYSDDNDYFRSGEVDKLIN